MVQQIEYGKEQVQAKTQSEVFFAKKILVTVPLGVLKANRIEFNPPLGADKRQSIEALGMGLLNKHFFWFDRVFWDANTDWHEYLSMSKGLWTEWVSFAKLGLPVLLGFSAAEQAREQEQWKDEKILESAHQALKEMFGAKTQVPLKYQFTRWGQDPFAMGSYSFHAVGSGKPERRVLAKPVDNKVFWAGEACSPDYWGTVHGAYLSGQAAAKAILDS
jgi:monoamine oxidase